jgi:hypothetical protein
MEHQDSISEYLSPEPAPKVTVSKSKKRKKPSDDGTRQELLEKARFHCKCPEQWRSVSKYSDKRMLEFIQEKEFTEQQQLYDSIFNFTLSIIASGLDVALQGNDYIRQEIEADVSLRQSIEQEGSRFIQFLNNKFRIVTLTSIDAFNGKKKQRLLEPTIVIEEISDGANSKGRGENHSETVANMVFNDVQSTGDTSATDQAAGEEQA